MPEIYVPPNSTDSIGIFELFRYINDTATDGLFFLVMISVLWVITFIGTKQFSASRAFTYASFISAILAIPLTIMNLIAPRYMYLFIILTAFGVLWLKLDTPPAF